MLRKSMGHGRKHLEDKPAKYGIRDEIKETVKEKSIDRKLFHEYPKTKYQKVINEFYYAFVNHEKYPRVGLDYCWVKFREDLSETDCISEDIGWECMLAKIKERLSYDWSKKVYLILSQGWVYEGYIDSMIDVLEEIQGVLDDFYIVTPQFDEFAAYCDDGECISFYRK